MKKQSQNKPNLLDAQMNVSSVLTKDYSNEQRTMNNERLCKSNPIKPNFRPKNTHFCLAYFNTCAFARAKTPQFPPNFRLTKHPPLATPNKMGRSCQNKRPIEQPGLVASRAFLTYLSRSSSSFLRYAFSRRVASRSKSWYLMHTRR